MNTLKKKDVADGIGAFMQKYPNKVEWPQSVFEVKSVSNVKIAEESLIDFDELWTYEGIAEISKTDERSTVTTRSKCQIIGSAKVISYENPTDSYLLPDVKEVTITKVTPITKK